MKLKFVETMLYALIANVCAQITTNNFKANKLLNGSSLCFDDTPNSVEWLPIKNAAVRCGVRCANVATSSGTQECFGYNVHAITGQCDIYQFVPFQSLVVNGCAAFSIPSAVCEIKVLAFNSLAIPCSSPTMVIGYVTLNQQRVWYGALCDDNSLYNSQRGVIILNIDPFRCIAHSVTRYDTFASTADSQALNDYIRSAAAGTVLVGVTGDDAATSLSPARDALASLGADVTTLQWRGNFAFIAQVGYKWKTLFQMIPQSETQNQSCIKALLAGQKVESLIIQSLDDC